MKIIRGSARERQEGNTSAGVNHNKQLLLFQFIFNITHFYDFTEVLLWWLLGTISSTEDRNIWPLCLKGFFFAAYAFIKSFLEYCEVLHVVIQRLKLQL